MSLVSVVLAVEAVELSAVSVVASVLVSPVSKPVPVASEVPVASVLVDEPVDTSPIVSIVVMPVVGCAVVPGPPLLLEGSAAVVLGLALSPVAALPGPLFEPQAGPASAAARAARASEEAGTRRRGGARMPCGSAARGRLSRAVAGCGRVAATMRASLPFVVLMAAACGEPAPPAAPAPAPVVAAAEPAAADPPAPPRGRVFLAASEAGLAPVACHLAHVSTFSHGDGCLVLMKSGSNARLESGQVTRVTGVGAAACGEGSALEVDAPVAALRGHAVAPVETDFVEVIPPVTPAEADRAAPAPLRARLREALLAGHPELAPAKGLQVRQVAQVDLDVDGAPETLAVIAVPAADPDAPPRFAGLYLVPAGDAPPRKLRGQPGAGVQYMLLGALDLDADGRPELWLNTYDDDGFAWSVEQVGSAGLTELGRRRCDA